VAIVEASELTRVGEVLAGNLETISRYPPGSHPRAQLVLEAIREIYEHRVFLITEIKERDLPVLKKLDGQSKAGGVLVEGCGTICGAPSA